MKFICPLILVKDIRQARRFYEDVLGQKVKFDYGQDVVFAGDFAIHLESHFKTLVGFGSRDIVKRSNNFELYFETEKLEEMYTKLVSEEVEFIHGIREQPWGQMAMRFYDFDENIIEIGETMTFFVRRLHAEGLGIDQICERTGLSAELVHNALNQKD